MEQCLEGALSDIFRHLRPSARSTPLVHRVPLGLLLLSRQQVTVEELRQALATQRAAGRGKIGEWLQALGFVNQEQVTSALARQWSCPVLRVSPALVPDRGIPQVPLSLMESCSMIPVGYGTRTKTLHLAFSERVDYSVLYAVEQMLGCHTEPCLVIPGFLRQVLQKLAQCRTDREIVFERLVEPAECARIVRSYAVRLSASEIRVARCDARFWVRLLRRDRTPIDLLLHSAGESMGSEVFTRR